MIAWSTAEKVARGVISTFPKEDPRVLKAMECSLTEFAPIALELVQTASGLTLDTQIIVVKCTSRYEWVQANATSMSALLDPLMGKMSKSFTKPMVSIGAHAGAVQFGLLFAWMSRRVLGQYDAALFANSTSTDGTVPPIYMVGANISSLEEKFGFPRAQFERWVLLHELTHKLQFEAVPWMQQYYTDLISRLLGGLNLGPSEIFDAITRVVEDLRDGRNPIGDAGLVGLFVDADQREALSKLGGLMSVLEGHGDLIMSRAAVGVITESDRFEEVLHKRRESPSVFNKLISQLLGLDAKIRQYEEGRKFLEAIELAGGTSAVMTLFESSDNFPDLGEISAPDMWLSRVIRPAKK